MNYYGLHGLLELFLAEAARSCGYVFSFLWNESIVLNLNSNPDSCDCDQQLQHEQSRNTLLCSPQGQKAVQTDDDKQDLPLILIFILLMFVPKSPISSKTLLILFLFPICVKQAKKTVRFLIFLPTSVCWFGLSSSHHLPSTPPSHLRASLFSPPDEVSWK